MKYTIQPSRVSGQVFIPPSKSHTLRAVLFALMAKGKSVIRNYLCSPDTYSMIEAIEQFGAKVEVFPDRIEIEGVSGVLKRPQDVIHAGNSGQVLRFISALSALVDSYVIITGDESIRKLRPIQSLLDALTSQNVFAESATLNGHPPVIIRGKIKPGIMAIDGRDSQPVSALLIMTAFLPGISEIYVMNPGEKPWVSLTLSWLSFLGVRVDHSDFRHYKVYGRAAYSGFDITIPGDFSTACFHAAAAAFTKPNVTLYGLNQEDAQPDKKFLDILASMGVRNLGCRENQSVQVFGDSQLAGVKVDINDCIDALPILAVLGCYASSPTEITGAHICRYKESDRISAMAQELKKMGAHLMEKEDGLIVYPSKLRGAEVNAHKDHRIAMALIVAALGAEGATEIEGVEHIAKTYPSFLLDFLELGALIQAS